MTAAVLAHLPTPVQRAPRLARALGLDDDALWVKRDDCTGLAGGGNKARKLVRIGEAALAADADVLVTGGGLQSNHVRQTAAAAAVLGLGCTALLAAHRPDEASGNLLLDLVLGADLVWAGAVDFPALDEAIVAEVDRLRAVGRRPHLVPVGGSSVEGAAAYADAVDELEAQLADVALVVVADGSGGTHAGLAAGFGDHGRVLGVDVGAHPVIADVVAGLADDVALATGRPAPAGTVQVDHDRVAGGYGRPDDATREALLLAARLEGLVLDQVYTAKAMAALVAAARDGRLDHGGRTVFLHTGGLPGLLIPKAAAWAVGADLAG